VKLALLPLAKRIWARGAQIRLAICFKWDGFHNHGLAFASCFPASLLQVSTLKNVLPLFLTPVEPTWQVLLVASDDEILQELRWAARDIRAKRQSR
jgi:hypothetical protein